MACAHQHASQSILKIFIFVLTSQVKYIDGLSGEPDDIEDFTSSFPRQTKATDCWSICFRLCPVSLGTRCRVKAHGGYFIRTHVHYGLWITFSPALIPGNGVFFWPYAHQPSAWISCPAVPLELCG